jgi:DNA topoisomerase-1
MPAAKKKTAPKSTRSKKTKATKATKVYNKPNLVIVESPAKARTLTGILGPDFEVIASMGHVRDLPSGKLGVDIENNFTPQYSIPRAKSPIVKEVKLACKTAKKVFLATDADREGEAISWHLMEAGGIDPKLVQRVVFHEITEKAILEAFKSPRSIDWNLVEAQQARRVLDRLVGYLLSPVLWKKVRYGLSAGRVQSAALRLVVDRQREIEAFNPKEYWSIETTLLTENNKSESIKARFHNIVGERKAREVNTEEEATLITNNLRSSSISVDSVKKRETKRRPSPPFITSTLQQEAFRKLRFTARRTMSVAQQLYEGLELDKNGPTGLITYMRTDSINMSQDAISEARSIISEKFSKNHIPKSPRFYKKNVKGAQEAHESIRPTSFGRSPDSIRGTLSNDQFRLYELIWKRAISSQMSDALFDQTSIDIHAKSGKTNDIYVLRSSGSIIKFDGYLAVYREGVDEPNTDSDEGREIPDLEVGQILTTKEVLPIQHFTQPPPRFTEASLVKALEERGIGRPSTYAAIMGTIQDRGYVDKEDNRFKALKLGVAVSDLLKEFFPEIVDLDFTSEMENQLDEIARGERERTPLLKKFFSPFNSQIEIAIEKMPKVKDIDESSDELCPLCGVAMVIKRGRFGPFLSCSTFPECKGTKKIESRTGVDCPECGKELVQRRSNKTKRTFYGCSGFPNCTFLVNQKPLTQKCPDCNGLVIPSTKGSAKCVADACKWTGSIDELADEEVSESAEKVAQS